MCVMSFKDKRSVFYSFVLFFACLHTNVKSFTVIPIKRVSQVVSVADIQSSGADLL